MCSTPHWSRTMSILSNLTSGWASTEKADSKTQSNFFVIDRPLFNKTKGPKSVLFSILCLTSLIGCEVRQALDTALPVLSKITWTMGLLETIIGLPTALSLFACPSLSADRRAVGRQGRTGQERGNKREFVKPAFVWLQKGHFAQCLSADRQASLRKASALFF